MEETYSLKELALAMNVSWQQVVSWKRHNQIPTAAITSEGKFLKAVIDPYIELYKNNSAQEFFPKSESKQKSPSSKGSERSKQKRYPESIRKEAIRLLSEEKLSVHAVAKKLGCAYVTVHRWKSNDLDSTATSEQQVFPVVSAMPPSITEDKKPLPEMNCDDFMRSYWQDGSRAVDVLLMPSEVGSQIVHYVNEALKYAFEKLR